MIAVHISTLFCRSSASMHNWNSDSSKIALQALNSKTDMGGSNPDEHMLLDDNKYVADVLYDIKNSKQKELLQSRLLFKKRMFRETDETITEAQFVNLSYVQVPALPC